MFPSGWASLETPLCHVCNAVTQAETIDENDNAETTDVGLLLLADALQRDQKPQDAAATEDLARKMSPDFERARQGARQTLGFFGVTPSTAH